MSYTAATDKTVQQQIRVSKDRALQQLRDDEDLPSEAENVFQVMARFLKV
jgi:hypothetical protein